MANKSKKTADTDEQRATPTIAEILAVLAEVGRAVAEVGHALDKLKESSAATDRQLKELAQQVGGLHNRSATTDRQLKATDRQQKETDRQLKATDRQQKETDRQLKELAQQVGGLHNRWGKIIESLVAGDFTVLLKQLGIDINHTFNRAKGNYQGDNWEIDILAENTDVVVPTEVKTTLQRTDIDNFIARILIRFTQLLPSYRNKKIYGAIAFVKTDGNESEIVNYALSKGLIVIKAMRGTNQLLNSKSTTLRDYCPR